MSHSFPTRVLEKIKSSTGLCVGLDPSAELLLSWGLQDTLDGLKFFCERMTAVCIESEIAFVKPQSAFFERFGWHGLKILSEMNQQLREADIMTILDCKRGDISSTAAAYADAYLSDHDFNKYDAITINPFLGYNSVEPFLSVLKKQNVGIFIVIRSSNPDSHYIQEATIENDCSVAHWLANKMQRDNDALYGEKKMGAIGAVVGATLNSIEPLLNKMPSSIFLCPGIGAQGATVGNTIQNLKNYFYQSIFPLSRGITLHTPEKKDLMKKIASMKLKFSK